MCFDSRAHRKSASLVRKTSLTPHLFNLKRYLLKMFSITGVWSWAKLKLVIKSVLCKTERLTFLWPCKVWWWCYRHLAWGQRVQQDLFNVCICVCSKKALPHLAFHFKIRPSWMDACRCQRMCKSWVVLICFPIHVKHLLAAFRCLYLKLGAFR